MSDKDREAWNETDSELFLQYGRAFTPQWKTLSATLLDLVPRRPDNRKVLCVDVGAGSGWLSEAILRNVERSYVIALDGSERMRAAMAERLAAFAGRFETRHFDLSDLGWVEELSSAQRQSSAQKQPATVDCVASSLALHHLDDELKQKLYAALYSKINPGGALLIADLVRAPDENERLAFAVAWEDAVRRQSRELYGDLRAYDAFCRERWNHYRYPDPIDKPALLSEMLEWLRESGFRGVDAFWQHAGHVLVGGFKG